MKLLNAYIINFGKFHEFDINFEDNLKPFLHENGWGKTTLSVFIKSMFYGMEHTTKKDLSENEKKKYMPWQGGTYGGSLSFSHNGKEYRVSRTFSDKKNGDTFELIDLKTNKKSTDFTSDLGTELFGIGRDTYGRSVHVTLDETPVGSNDISARLNNLVEADDIANFDEAIIALEKNSKVIKGKRGETGELSVIQAKIEEDRAVLEDIDSKLKQNKECEKRIIEKNDNIFELKKQQNDITEQLTNNAKYESKIRYEQLKRDVEESEKAKETVEKFFNGKIPTTEMISNMDFVCSSFSTVESNIKTQSATQSQKNDYEQLKNYFGGDIPSEEQISECIKADNDYNIFKQTANSLKLTSAEENEYDSLKLKYSDGNITSDIIAANMANVETVQKKKSELSDKKSELNNLEAQLQVQQQIKPKNTKKILFLVIGVIGVIFGTVGFIFKIIPLGIGGIAAGLALVLFGILVKGQKQDFSRWENSIKDKKSEIEVLNQEITSIENQYKMFVSKYCPNATSELFALNAISTEFDSYKKLAQKADKYNEWLSNQKTPEEFENIIRAFMSRYCNRDDISSVSTQIQILNDKLNKLKQLENLINADSNNEKEISKYKEKLDVILADYQTDKAKSYAEQIRQIHEQMTTLKNYENQISDAKDRLSDFENNPDNDISSFENLVKPEKSVDELQSMMSQLTENINAENKIVSDYTKTIEDNLTFTDKKEDIETEIESLSLKKQEKANEHKILLKTIELLSKAKENLDANYSDPMKEGFNKYVNMIGSNLNLIINTDLEINVDSNGQLHESASLSEGYKDMVNFCSRMALVDALFTDVKPPIILDDPFVNLDDEKVPNALKLVKELSKEKQVIYFACHKSREIR